MQGLNVAVVQPLPGIGDMIWHQPHIRAIADHVGAAVTLIAKPRSAADQLFRAEPAVREVLWLDRNPERRRGRHDGPAGLLRFVRTMRGRHFDAVYLLHHSETLACTLLAAGVPARFGYGHRLQRLTLNRTPFLSTAALGRNPHDQATAWLAAAGISLRDPEPQLRVDGGARDTVTRRIGTGPFVSIGLGSSEPLKQWGAERFALLATGLIASGRPSSLVLVGGSCEATLAHEVVVRLGEVGRSVRLAIGWDLCELAALLACSAFYVGNDTGVMNLAAAVGTTAYGLFGATPPLHHSRHIVAITPPQGGIDLRHGMARITPEAVMAAIGAGASAAASPAAAL
jgi:heptosyltransferase-2